MFEVNLYSLKQIQKKEEEWNSRALSRSSISQTVGWALASSTIRNKPLFITVSENNNWVASWLVFMHYSVIGRVIEIASEPIINSNQNHEKIYFIMMNILEKLRPARIDYLNFVHSRLSDKDILKKLMFTNIYEYNTYIIDLNQPLDLIWKGIHKKHRNDIRYAQKVGVTIEETNNVKLFYDLQCETYARSNKKPTSLKLLSVYYNVFASSKIAHIFLARYQGKPLAAVFMLCFGNKVLYFKGATANQLIRGSANLLHWYLIKLFKQEGYQIYDFGGALLTSENTKILGIKLFKSRFGGKELLCYGGSKILSPFKERVFNMIKRLKL